MTENDINRITVDDVWAMILKSWELAKFNYGLTLTIGFFIALGAFLSTIPFLGPFLGGLVSALSPLIFLKAAKQWENGHASHVNELVDTVKNRPLLEKMLPLMLIQAAAYAGPQLIAQIPYVNVMFGWIGLFTLPISLVVNVAFPILFFNQNLPYQKTISLALDGIIKNIGPFAFGVLILMGLLIVSTILFVLPLFLVGLPIFFIFQYIWYRVIYEDLRVEVPDQAII